MNTATGLPTPDDLTEAIDQLAQTTGYPLWASRLALARGDIRLAYRGLLEHQRLVNARIMPRVDPRTFDSDGLDPTELLRREAELPTNDDQKRGLR